MTGTTKSPTSDEHATASSQRFVDAALDLFIEHGFNGTSLQMIGDPLGVSKAAVTYHFRSKDELLAAVVRPAVDDLRETLDIAESVKRVDPTQAGAQRLHGLPDPPPLRDLVAGQGRGSPHP